MAWQPEKIPDQDFLFMRIHERWREDGDVAPGAFRNHGDGMSTDWEKYAKPHQTRERARQPECNAVVRFEVGSVRQVPGQRVEHTPDVESENRAHADVYGDKNTEIRVKLRRLAEIAIGFDVPAG